MWSNMTVGRFLGTRLVAFVVPGSGLVNVFSVISDPVGPEEEIEPTIRLFWVASAT